MVKHGQEDMHSYSGHPAFSSSFLPDGPKFTQQKGMFSVGKPPSIVERDQEPQGIADNFAGHIYGNQPNSPVNLPPPNALAEFFSSRQNPFQPYNFPNRDSFFSQQQFPSYPQIPQKQESGFGIIYPEQAQIYTGPNVMPFLFH